ncbi:MAG: hypothetical protein IPM48_09185 [Saprospiraceae bacterium]|nr:hypothetical protein [Saprospiraceae bacterium]
MAFRCLKNKKFKPDGYVKNHGNAMYDRILRCSIPKIWQTYDPNQSFEPAYCAIALKEDLII